MASRTNVERLQIRNNVVSGSGIVIGHDSVGDSFFSFGATVARNELRDNAGDGLRFQTGLFSSSEFGVQNNRIDDNGGHGARFAVAVLRNARVADNQLRGNGVAGLAVDGREVRSTVIRDNLVSSNRGPGIDIDATREITALQIHDNRLLDNAGVGLAVATGNSAEGEYVIRENLVAANGYGIFAAGPQTARIDRNEIVFNTYGLGAPVPIEEVDPGVGVVVADGQDNFYLVDNDIYGHEIGLHITTGGTVEAATNYWGAESGPYHQSINPEGEGDAAVTDRGWADIIHAETGRIGREHARPIARIEVDPVPARPGKSVTVSAAGSSDADGRVDTYQFTIRGDEFVTTVPTRSVS